MWTLGMREKTKTGRLSRYFIIFCPSTMFFPRQAHFARKRTPHGGKLTWLYLRGGSGGGGAQVSQAQGSGDQRGPFFLLPGQNVSNLALPTSRSELLTRGAIYRFHHIPTETLFREEQRSPGVPGERMRAALDSEAERNRGDGFESSERWLGEAVCVGSLFLATGSSEIILPRVSSRRTRVQPWASERDAGRQYAEAKAFF